MFNPQFLNLNMFYHYHFLKDAYTTVEQCHRAPDKINVSSGRLVHVSDVLLRNLNKYSSIKRHELPPTIV